MGSCLEERGHLAILIYFTIFGSCFLASSSFYFVNLDKIQLPNDDPCVPGLLEYNSTNGSEINCTDVQEWKLFAFCGIVYGILCLIVALLKLWPTLRRIYCPKAATAVINRPKRSNQPTLRSAAGGKVVRKANAGVRKLVQKEEEKRSFTKTCSSCGHCLSTCSIFFGVVVLWIISVVVPAFLAVNLYQSNAIRAKDDGLYVPAMALFATCLTSFTAVCVSCAFIILESDQDWNHAILDDESKDIDPEAVTSPLTSSHPMTTTTTTVTTNDAS